MSTSDSQVNSLALCPFCGGEAEKLTSSDGFTSIGCLSCNPFFGVMIQRSTEAEAIAAWNSRADYHGYEQAAIEAWESIKAWNTRAERTCHDASVDSSTQFYCSECECTVDVPLLWGEVNYCPNCGAKVVGE